MDTDIDAELAAICTYARNFETGPLAECIARVCAAITIDKPALDADRLRETLLVLRNARAFDAIERLCNQFQVTKQASTSAKSFRFTEADSFTMSNALP